jgi:hypothetical protein
MANVRVVLQQLQRQRNQLEFQISRLDKAIRTLLGLKASGKRTRKTGSRRISAAARARIAAAQKERWAKWRKQHS